MTTPDLSLLPALDALLSELSVTRAARKIGLSTSAMSRTLERLRATTGDPLLVRAGRRLVLTPHAVTLRERVTSVTHEAISLLRPDDHALDLGGLKRTFTIRANDGFVETVGAMLVVAARAAAPGARLRFTPKPDKDVRALREGDVDLDIGVLGASGPEILIQTLFRDRFLGAARKGHPLLEVPITPQRYAACEHVVASRRGVMVGPVDRALTELGLSREVVVVVPSFAAALAMAANSELVTLLPQSFISARANTQDTIDVITTFELPVQVEGITVSQMWHPRVDADPGHRWLRRLVRKVTATGQNADLSNF
jgi:DNA-binding transcriptional LysR family regulator